MGDEIILFVLLGTSLIVGGVLLVWRAYLFSKLNSPRKLIDIEFFVLISFFAPMATHSYFQMVEDESIFFPCLATFLFVIYMLWMSFEEIRKANKAAK